MPKVSVLLPMWNTQLSHLQKSVDSILAQTFTDFELVVLNDSPENVSLKDFINAYGDNRIKYYENRENVGIAKSYNRLVDLAKGEYVAMMNHDDVSLPNRLQKQSEFLDNNPEVGLVGSAYKKFGEINRFKTVENPLKHNDIVATLLFKSPIHHPTIMFRRDVMQHNNIRYDDEFVSLNDRKLYVDFAKVCKLANMPDVLYKYRFHKDMVSKRLKNKIQAEQVKFHRAWFEKNGVELSDEEQGVFNNFVTKGRCHITDRKILVKVKDVLEKLAAENKRLNLMPEPEFSEVCGAYLVKRCLNAAVYGGVYSQDLLDGTDLLLPTNVVLKLCNLALKWRN